MEHFTWTGNQFGCDPESMAAGFKTGRWARSELSRSSTRTHRMIKPDAAHDPNTTPQAWAGL